MKENTIKLVLLDVIKAYHSYLGNEVWEETLLKANNGDCIWIAQLTAYVLRQAFDFTVEIQNSPHHTFLMHNGKVYDTLNFDGGNVLSLPFYGVSSEHRNEVVPLDYFRLAPWDKDIHSVIHHVCGHYEIVPMTCIGHEFGEPEPIVISSSMEEQNRLEVMDIDVEYRVSPGFDAEHVHVVEVKDKNLGN
ncbi:hypothetical protein HWC35_gp171 [Vibrio phage USC-1]|uniref:Uncharacterized protein n=2 Tax=Aphroditevirus USC1 TaxID=2846605 RepID=A0A514A2T5_9CAUD|nr:hypothetical protein HWC35_gp171 [Vibrio phage USC-1]QCW23163.1 hypothetical protein [Vibrio phage 5 TSL-2019]QDH47565.1 hypothetical protein [Vibrio phage USC-1]